jgi:pimeloyl-ACP methyl ester carboxylesterase
MPAPVERFFHNGEVAINYAEFPPSTGSGRRREGGKPLLLIHGLSGRWQGWRPVIPGLTERWHVYAIDLRGHGRSGHATAVYDRAAYSKDAAAFIEKVVGGPACVIGHSLGALTALGVAAGWPMLVKAFVMEDPPLYVHDRWEGSSSLPGFVKMRELAESDLSVGQIATEISKVMPERGPDGWQERAECIFQMDHVVWQGVFGGHYAMKKDSDPLLKTAAPPAFLMQAEPSLGAALEDGEARHAMSLLPAAQFVKWPDSGHGMHSTFPDRFVEQVEAFFKGK